MRLAQPTSRRSRLLAGAGALLAASVAGAVLAAPATAAAPDGDYIVVLKDSVSKASDVAAQHRRAHGAGVTRTYETALKGYAARLSGRALADVRSDARVAFVEVDGVAQPTAVQSSPTWGLDRIDQVATAPSGTFTYTATGAGVTAFVIDSGIRPDHPDFEERVKGGKSFVSGKEHDTTDCGGHGTHVAGTIGSRTWGVAKDVTLAPVRVFDCTGGAAWSTVIAAVDWVTANGVKPAVVNMSLSGGASSAMDTAVKNSIAKGFTYALAAGNSNADACRSSPARVPEALTVGATDRTDKRASFSNFGKCLDLFAPGVEIVSTYLGAGADTKALSGTSMAAPHVAGVAAQQLQVAPHSSPAHVAISLVTGSTADVVLSAGRGSPNRLLFTTR